MKTPVLRKKIKNVIIDPYDFSRTFNDLSPFGIIENYSIISDGHLRYSVPDYEDSPNETDEDRKKKIDANTVDTYIFKIPAYFASLDLDSKYLLYFNGFAYYDKSVLKLFNKPSQKTQKVSISIQHLQIIQKKQLYIIIFLILAIVLAKRLRIK